MKATRKYLLLCAFVVLWLSSKAQNITKVEYFMDSDPGPGLADNIPITPATNISKVAYPVNISGLSLGIHRLYLRVLDANGSWSLTNVKTLYKLQQIISAGGLSKIVKMEYYIDSDPGFGLANDIPVTPAVNISKVAYTIDISGLALGIHRIYLRARDSIGSWSLNNVKTFYKLQQIISTGGLSKIVKMEYFIDNDPGLGLANDIPIIPDTNISKVEYPVNISGLGMGIHRIYLRTRDSIGSWSLTNVKTFYKIQQNQNAGLAKIVKMEYFVDNDPGFGKGFNVPVTPSTAINEQIIPDLTLCKGLHTLYVRVQDSTGGWSLTNMDTITVPDHPSPVLTVNGNAKFCHGGQVQLKATSYQKVTYQWKRDNVTIAGALDSSYFAVENGTHKSILTHQNTCSDTTNAALITVYPVYAILDSVSINQGGSYHLPNGTYVSAAGNYVSNLTSINGCDSIITTVLTVNTGVKSTKSLVVNLYPNPSKSGIFLINNESFDKFKITIYNTNGEILYYDQISGKGIKKINLSGKPQGIYVVKIVSEDYVGIEKLIIE